MRDRPSHDGGKFVTRMVGGGASFTVITDICEKHGLGVTSDISLVSKFSGHIASARIIQLSTMWCNSPAIGYCHLQRSQYTVTHVNCGPIFKILTLPRLRCEVEIVVIKTPFKPQLCHLLHYLVK